MRTLKLTQQQIELIVQALGISEQKFTDIHRDIISKTITVRGNVHDSDEAKTAQFFHEKACLFADLNVSIDKFMLDI